MPEMHAIVPAGGRPVSIRDLAPGHFWTRESELGTTPEEAQAMQRGELPQERVIELQLAMNSAIERLQTIEVLNARQQTCVFLS